MAIHDASQASEPARLAIHAIRSQRASRRAPGSEGIAGTVSIAGAPCAREVRGVQAAARRTSAAARCARALGRLRRLAGLLEGRGRGLQELGSEVLLEERLLIGDRHLVAGDALPRRGAGRAPIVLVAEA